MSVTASCLYNNKVVIWRTFRDLFYNEHETFRFKLNIWDVGGQKSLRSYWRNYFESTDGLIWVVDSADKRRLQDCKLELHNLLLEEVTRWFIIIFFF